MFVNQTNKTYRLALELSRLIIFLKVVDIISAKIIDRRLSLDAQARFPDVPLKSLVIRVRRGDQKPGTEQNQNPHFGMKKKTEMSLFHCCPTKCCTSVASNDQIHTGVSGSLFGKLIRIRFSAVENKKKTNVRLKRKSGGLRTHPVSGIFYSKVPIGPHQAPSQFRPSLYPIE